MAYKAPIEDISFLLNHVLSFNETLALDAFNALDEALCEAVLEEAGKFAANELATYQQIRR